jgi:hypothetical protein
MPTPPPYDVLLARDFLSIRILLATYGNIGVATTLDNKFVGMQKKGQKNMS